MCVGAAGMAIASFAIGAAQTVMQFQSESAQASLQNDMHEQNRIEANRAATEAYANQQNRMVQERNVASQEMQNLNLEGLKARSSAAVSAGEAGVTGLSVDALIRDFYAQQGRHEQALTRNHQMNSTYLRSEMDATKAQASNRTNSVQRGQKPSFAGAAVRLLGSGVGAYDQHRRNSSDTT